jgi:hypothetical protein
LGFALQTIELSVFDIPWRVQCADDHAYSLLQRNFLDLTCSHVATAAVQQIFVDAGTTTRWSLRREGRDPHPVLNAYELLYAVEKTITIETQLQRRDLFFLHAAALTLNDSAVLLIAQSGAGKSTTAWAMANRGFGYMSDELAPIDLHTMRVQPYPHALCLKRPPPAPFDLPSSVISTLHTLHVTTDCIPIVERKPTRLRAVFFNRYDPRALVPGMEAISSGEAASLVYRNGLNQLAHEQAGLEGAAKIARVTPCYRLTTNDLERTCSLMLEALQSVGVLTQTE